MIIVHENDDATEEYKKSVDALVRVAQMGGSGSRVAAQVLLSAYNGYDFHVDVPDLSYLDEENFGHALRAIWGRCIAPCMEPHQAIENGDAVFSELWQVWRRLHVQNRWKRECDYCNGSGRVWTDENMIRQAECRNCDGRGLHAEIKWPGFDTA